MGRGCGWEKLHGRGRSSDQPPPRGGPHQRARRRRGSPHARDDLRLGDLHHRPHPRPPHQSTNLLRLAEHGEVCKKQTFSGSESNIDGCFLIRALYRGGFGNNELHYYLTNLVTGERVEVCRGQAVTDYLKVRVRLAVQLNLKGVAIVLCSPGHPLRQFHPRHQDPGVPPLEAALPAAAEGHRVRRHRAPGHRRRNRQPGVYYATSLVSQQCLLRQAHATCDTSQRILPSLHFH